MKGHGHAERKSDQQGVCATGGRNALSCRRFGVSLVVVVLAILWALPSSIDPIAFSIGEVAFEGPLTVNDHLKKGKLLFHEELLQPEAFVTDEKGFIYTGLGDGRLVRLDPDLSSYTTVLRVGQPPCDSDECATAFSHSGRILGLQFHNSNPDILYAADSYLGLLEINVQLKTVKVLVPQDQHDGGDIPFIHFSNNLAVLPNGSIFFTDSSTKFKLHDFVFDVLEGRANGQLLHYNPAEKKVHVVSRDLYFPNGICLSHDGNSLLVAELSRARILRYHLTGTQAGRFDIFMDNLPGFPDNLSRSKRGSNYWIAMGSTRTMPNIERLMTKWPSVRSLLVKLGLTHFIYRAMPKHSLVVEVDQNGQILRSLHDRGGDVAYAISHVLDLGDRLLLGSFEAPHAVLVPLDSN